MAAPEQERPWYAIFPEPTTNAPTFTKENLLRSYYMLGDVLQAGMLLVDLRRTDYEGGTIRGSLNIPAQSFYLNMATLYRLCRGDGVGTISRVLFYCGSSSGRAPRCAAWFQEYVAARGQQEGDGGVLGPAVFVLEGGIKGWVNGGQEYVQYVEGFSPGYWQQFAPVPGVAANKRMVEDHVGGDDVQQSSKRARDED